MSLRVFWKHKFAVALLIAAALFSLKWGSILERNAPGGLMGFPGLYYGTRCLLQGGDPYDSAQLARYYQDYGIHPAVETPQHLQAIALYVNMPATSLLVAPLASLPLPAAQAIWNAVLLLIFLFAALLVWQAAAQIASGPSLLLSAILLANCEVLFAGGNTAELVVGLVVIAVWCLMEDRSAWAGVACLALALAVKPHDAGLLWLCLLLAGGKLRARALAAAGGALAITVASVIWMTSQGPHWLGELRGNLALISGPEGINNPGPHSIGIASADMIIDLQTALSVFCDRPAIYNLAAYLICGAILAPLVISIPRLGLKKDSGWFALASAAALSMLFTYHRSYDARLLLVAVPACAILWRRGGSIARWALAVTLAAFVFTADIPLVADLFFTRNMSGTTGHLGDELAFVLAARPAPLVLLVLSGFYLWTYWKSAQWTDALPAPGPGPTMS